MPEKVEVTRVNFKEVSVSDTSTDESISSRSNGNFNENSLG